MNYENIGMLGHPRSALPVGNRTKSRSSATGSKPTLSQQELRRIVAEMVG